MSMCTLYSHKPVQYVNLNIECIKFRLCHQLFYNCVCVYDAEYPDPSSGDEGISLFLFFIHTHNYNVTLFIVVGLITKIYKGRGRSYISFSR